MIHILLGPDHYFSSSFIDTSKVIKRILKKVNTFVIETDTTGIDKDYVKEVIIMKNDEHYFFKNEDEEKLLYLCIKNIIGQKISYDKIKPMVLYTLLQYFSRQNVKTGKSHSKFKNIDQFFEEKGKKKGNRLLTLETPEEQLALLYDSIPIKRQTELLMGFVKAYCTKPTSTSIIDSCYEKQDLTCLYYLFIAGYDRHEIEMLVYNRNKNWIKKLPLILNSNPSVIAVGALHLVGHYGLIRLLRDLGYYVTPVLIK